MVSLDIHTHYNNILITMIDYTRGGKDRVEQHTREQNQKHVNKWEDYVTN